ncbi:carboxymuconolactone decarboxylase family protein [uncultured Pelagimonas sp.]|uniref:carboxymuconolactone decarboxylase family protein n=1 Tax=uncultured Pelagimonas sp. TaxID=1618102 RepID=UPI003459FD4B
MQNRYVGDIGDYVKFGLLRRLIPNRTLGVAWYLHPDEGHNSDGAHIRYLEQSETWRSFDPGLFDALQRVVASGRSLRAIENSGLLEAQFHSDPLIAPKGPAQRSGFRTQWFETVQTRLSACDLVFADPDNGIIDDKPDRRRDHKLSKQIPIGEVRALAKDRTAIIYHHNTRFKGGHDAEVDHWIGEIDLPTLAVRSTAYNCRTFFVVNPDEETARQVQSFCQDWSGAKVHLHGDGHRKQQFRSNPRPTRPISPRTIPMTNTTETGRTLSEELNPGMEAALEARYGHLIPGMAEGVVDFAYGRQYARPGLPLRDRYLATIAALTALGGQTAPQLKVNIAGGLKAGLTQEEIAETIWQMSLYGGFPAAINALNAALEVFDDHGLSPPK